MLLAMLLSLLLLALVIQAGGYLGLSLNPRLFLVVYVLVLLVVMAFVMLMMLMMLMMINSLFETSL
ncbi:hypothetical protein CL648_02410 [bacterium]|nr:hypothetical protein [bacterium]